MAPAKPALDACRRYARLINLLRAAGGARAHGRGLGSVAVAVTVRAVVGEGQRGLGLELQLEAGGAGPPAPLVLQLVLVPRGPVLCARRLAGPEGQLGCGGGRPVP